MSVCFKIGDVALDTSGLRDAMVDFFLNNPVTKAPSSRFKSRGLPARGLPARGLHRDSLLPSPVGSGSKKAGLRLHLLLCLQLPQAVKDAVDKVIDPIKVAIEEVQAFVEELKSFFDGLSFGRRLEELTPAEVVHARGLKEQAHRQLEQVRGRLLHADNDDARDSTKERLLLDVHRRLEAHLAERKLLALPELLSISSLKTSILFNLDSRMLIEAQKDQRYLFPLVTKDNKKQVRIPLPPLPFTLKLAGSFSVDVLLDVEVEGDLKVLVRLAVDGIGIEFDLSKIASSPVVFSEGDWTQAIT